MRCGFMWINISYRLQARKKKTFNVHKMNTCARTERVSICNMHA
jgi:hypothetical protein